MKRFLFVLIVLGTMSCNVTKYYEPKYTLGMEEVDFKRLNKNAIQVYGDQKGPIVYRTYNAYMTSYKFFVFEKGKLIKFEDGVYPDDYKFMRF